MPPNYLKMNTKTLINTNDDCAKVIERNKMHEFYNLVENDITPDSD